MRFLDRERHGLIASGLTLALGVGATDVVDA